MLISPGIAHHSVVCDAATDTEQWQPGQLQAAKEALNEAPQPSMPLVLASSSDLTLEEVDRFLEHVLANDASDTEGAGVDVTDAAAWAAWANEKGGKKPDKPHKSRARQHSESAATLSESAAAAAAAERKPEIS